MVTSFTFLLNLKIWVNRLQKLYLQQTNIQSQISKIAIKIFVSFAHSIIILPGLGAHLARSAVRR